MMNVAQPISLPVGGVAAGMSIGPHGTAGLAAELLAAASMAYPSMPSELRLETYERIPIHILTAHTGRLLEVKGLRDYLSALAPADFAQNPDEAQSAVRRLTQIAYPVMDIYSENGLLPAFAIKRVIDEAFEAIRKAKEKAKEQTVTPKTDQYAVAMQIDFDVWKYNRDDKTGSLLDELIPAISAWFIENIRHSKKVYELFGKPPTIIRTSQRTGIVIISPNAEQGEEFIRFVHEELNHFEADMKKTLQKAQDEGRVSSKVDIGQFTITGTAHHARIRLNGIQRLSRVDRVQRVSNELARLAAKTKFLKDNPPLESALVAGGIYFYDDPALPKKGDQMFTSLEFYIDNKLGYVFPGQFGHQSEKDPESRAELEYHDFGHDLGEVSHPPRRRENGNVKNSREDDGGAVELLWLALNGLMKGEITEETLSSFRRCVDDLVLRILNLGEAARRFSRYPLLVKAKRYWDGENPKERADFFIEEIARYDGVFGIKYDAVAAIEVDDGRAFGENHPSPDMVDGHFQTVKALLFKTAKEWNMFPPVMAAEGDQIRVAFSTITTDGRNISSDGFLKEYQSRVREHFAGMQFQPFAKVETRDGRKRLPVWVNSTGEFLVQSAKVDGFREFKKGLTVTVTYTDMPDLSAENGGAVANGLVRQMFSYIDTNLKKQNGPFIKEGFGRLPTAEGENI